MSDEGVQFSASQLINPSGRGVQFYATYSYYGNISPHERYIKRGTRVDKLVKLICNNEEELNAGLTEKQKETFEKFKDCTSELSCITEREAFSSGFSLATRIMVEGMQGLEEVEDI